MWFLLTAAWKPWKAYSERLEEGWGKGQIPRPSQPCTHHSSMQSLASQLPLWGGNKKLAMSQRNRTFPVLDTKPTARIRGSCWPNCNFPTPGSHVRANFKVHTRHSITGGCLRCSIRIRITSNRRTGLRGFAMTYTACLWEPPGIRCTASRARATVHQLSHSSTFRQSTLPHCANLG